MESSLIQFTSKEMEAFLVLLDHMEEELGYGGPDLSCFQIKEEAA